MYRLIITVIFCSILGTVAAQNHASNIRTLVSDEQLIIYYDLSEKADIEVHASFDGGVNFRGPLRYVVGAVGKDIAAENDKVIVWNVVSEFGNVDFPNAIIKIVATTEPPKVEEPPRVVERQPPPPQGYKPFRVDLCLGVSMPFGGLFLIEPKYAVVPALSIGLKLESAVLLNNFFESDKSDINVQVLLSYFATADYHFLPTNNFRPFIGAGGGLYMIGAAQATSYGTTVTAEQANNFGAMVRAGFDVSHFRLAFVYNYAGNDGFNNSANYFGINIGAYIGGGRYK